MKKKVIYYQDELNDDFSNDNIKSKIIDEKYKYYENGLWKRITHFFWYRIIATPIAYMYLKIRFKHRIINRKILKKYKSTGYFIYGNHTHNIADAFIPSMLSYPKHTYVIVHSNNVSMPYLGRITPSLGAIPLPDTKEATRNFSECIRKRIEESRCICIYPEAHIWPYYTKIRNYNSSSFSYPVHYGVPAFSFTNVYLKRKFTKRARIITYIDGPFISNPNLSVKEQREEVRNKIYNKMVERSRLNNIEVIKYIKKDVIE